MLFNRIIPCLLLKNSGLVKTINFKNPKYVGDPLNTVRIFNEKEVDELIFLDIDASPKNTEPNYKLLAEIANECFMPLAYGGGIKTFEQAQRIFNIGIEKVAINTASYSNLNLISQIAKVYGIQAVIGVIDVKKNLFGKNQLVSNSANTKHKLAIEDWIKKLEDAGIGELLITSVDSEGTWKGLDLELIKLVTSISKVPVIAHGGVGNEQHIIDGIKIGKANAVAIGSFLVYQKQGMGVLINYPNKKIVENI